MKKLVVLAIVLGCAAILGCGSRVKEETIQVKPIDPMDQVKQTLERYAKGEPMTSEVTSFDYMVNQLKEKDPAKADILAKGLEDLKKAPKGQLAGKAKELMTKLGIK
jgi:outer membrane murein-binding lipoprotein Lpp